MYSEQCAGVHDHVGMLSDTVSNVMMSTIVLDSCLAQ